MELEDRKWQRGIDIVWVIKIQGYFMRVHVNERKKSASIQGMIRMTKL